MIKKGETKKISRERSREYYKKNRSRILKEYRTITDNFRKKLSKQMQELSSQLLHEEKMLYRRVL